MKWIDLAVVDWQRRAYILVPDENSQKGPTRKLPSRFASTGQEGSIDIAMDLLPREIAGCACAENAGKVLPVTDQPWVVDPGMHHGACRDACRDR